ncbi:MAG: redoxin domain-containing protein [Planctomycetota bacterium]
MRPLIIGILCVSILGAGLARADLKTGTYAPDIEAKAWANTDGGQPVSLAELRGMVVVLFFWSTWDEIGEHIMPIMTLLGSKRLGQGNGVFVMGLTDAEQKRVEEMLKKQKVFFPVGFEARKSFEDFDIKNPPRIVIIDPTGKIAWSGWAVEKSGQAAFDELEKAALATPPWKTHPLLAAKVHAYLREARAALREDNFREAAEAAAKAYENALRGDPLKTHCQDFLDLLDALGRDKLAQAERALDEKRYADVISTLLEVRREFKGHQLAITARKRLDAIRKKHKEAAELLTQMEAGGQAEGLLAAAMEELRAAAGRGDDPETTRRKVGGAYARLEEIVNTYAATPTAQKAETLMERIGNNADLMAYVKDYKAERACRMLLSQAEAYLQTGRTARARELYREVIDKYGDTIWSQDAAQRLSQLP